MKHSWLLWGLLASGAQARAAGPVIQVTDVSPNRPFGSPHDTDVDPSGRMVALAADPHAGTLYAASERAGVWRSMDGAHTWTWASGGLENGRSIFKDALAIDDVDPRRLVYATNDDDQRVAMDRGGLWASIDGATHWIHRDLGCPTPRIGSVAFADGEALVTTRCGLATSTDLTNWTLLRPDPDPTKLPPGRAVGRAGHLYACEGTSLWHSPPPSPGDARVWSRGNALPGACAGLVVAPDDPLMVLAIWISGPLGPRDHGHEHIDVSTVDFGAGTAVRTLGLPQPPSFCCGGASVYAVRRPTRPAGGGPGQSYDVFASNEYELYEYRSGTTWAKLPKIHEDTFAVVATADYDPEHGHCGLLAASDGGVSARRSSGTQACETFGGDWVRASSGLHTLSSGRMAGVSQAPCGTPRQACPILYLPTADDGTWVTRDGGQDGWFPLGCCGDSGSVLLDVVMPQLVVTARNDCYEVYRASGRGAVRGDDRGNHAPPPLCPHTKGRDTVSSAYDGIAPPEQSALVQILTLPHERPALNGDYLVVASPSHACPGDPGPDRVVRNRRAGAGTTNTGSCTDNGSAATDWTDLSPADHTSFSHVAGLSAAGGHAHPVVYVLTANFDPADDSRLADGGRIFRGVVGPSGVVPAWSRVAGNGLQRAYNLIGDPYDSAVLYATDLDAGQIVSTSDSGQTWTPEPELTRIATHYGEFRFACGAPADPETAGVFNHACPLAAVLFVYDHPEIRIAVLHPGGAAFSRDAGRHWISLAEAFGPLDKPIGAYYYETLDAASQRQTSLYVNTLGRGVLRLDAPFPRLFGVDFTVRAPSGTTGVAVLDPAGGPPTTLALDPADGLFHGTRVYTQDDGVDFRYELRPAPGGQPGSATTSVIHRPISSAEAEAGVATITETLVPVAFRLQGLPAGHSVELIDGATRIPLGPLAGGSYGGFELVPSSALSVFRYQYRLVDRNVSTPPLTHPVTAAERGGGPFGFAIIDSVAAASVDLTGNPPVTSPGTPQRFVAGYADAFGTAAIDTPGLTIADARTGTSIATMSFDLVGDRVCLRGPSLLSREHPTGVTVQCRPRAEGGTLEGEDVSLSVADTHDDASGNRLAITWAFTLRDAAASRGYQVTTSATDRVGLRWLPLVPAPLAVTHRPVAVGVHPRLGSAPAETLIPFEATYTDADGAADLRTLALTLEGGAMLLYDRSTNRMRVDGQDSRTPDCTPGRGPDIVTKNLTLVCSASASRVTEGNTLVVLWAVRPHAALAGRRYPEIARAADTLGADSGDTALGTFGVDAAP